VTVAWMGFGPVAVQNGICSCRSFYIGRYAKGAANAIELKFVHWNQNSICPHPKEFLGDWDRHSSGVAAPRVAEVPEWEFAGNQYLTHTKH
jgi:hypothetical protein